MIEVDGLTKRYGDTVAVDRLSFRVTPGRVTGFLGPNGAGKSTTMRLILGLDAPTSGSVTINGAPYRRLHGPLFEVGALLEAASVHGGRSAFNHLLWLAQTNGIPKSRVNEVLEIVGLTMVARRRLAGFSLGMSQRVGIAVALLGDPPVLLFDEPVNGLDPEGILWVRTLMHSLAAEGRTIFVSSHLMSEMALTASHLIVIGRGKLIADASIDDIIASSSQRSVTVRTPEPAALEGAIVERGGTVQAGADGALVVSGLDAPVIGELAFEHRVCLHELTPHLASLEEAFMDLTRDSVDFHAGPAIETETAT